MFWYLGGAVISAAVAWQIRRRKREKVSWWQAAMAISGGFILACLLWASDGKATGSDYVERGKPGEGNQEKEYILDAGKLLKEYPWNIKVKEQKYSKEEKKKVLQKAQKELEKQILGENKNLEEINKELYLPETLQKGTVEVTYLFSNYNIFYPDGTIKGLPEEETVVIVSAEMKCQEETAVYEFGIKAVPQDKNPQELLIEQIQNILIQENEKTGKDKLMLPQEVKGNTLIWQEKIENRSLPVAALGIAAAGCILLLEKEKEKKKQKEREKQLQMDYPEIIGKFTLLMGSGMNASTAWKKIAETYLKRRKEKRVPVKPAYEEMLTAVYEMQDGVGEIRAYENFGDRCAIAEYRRFSAILVQNVRKGNAQIQKILEKEKIEAYEKQKARVKIAGEEAGTKLLLPMLLMLLIVLIIIMVPTGMSLKI